MFELVKQDSRLNAVMYATSLLASLAAHAAVLLVLVVMPLVFFNVLHADELLTFLYEPPQPPAPPPIPTVPRTVAANPGRVVSIASIDTAPSKIPLGVIPETEVPDLTAIEHVVPAIGVTAQGAGDRSAISDLLASTKPPELPRLEPPVKRTPVHVGGRVQESKLIYKVNPIYPELARRIHLSGTVVLEAVIDEEGNVSEVKILSGHPFLTEAAVQAVKQWKYSPTVLNGEPVPVMATVTVIFQIR